ncbi:MAG: RNA polymerase sigma factor [bacterium]|nr:RNA polymerase sigma factor [bacterium]
MQGQSDDLQQLVAARDGDHRAGAELLRRHGASMLRTARGVTGRPEDAEDIVQEALIAALTTSSLPRGDVGAWLRAIAARKALDGLRRAKRRAESVLGDEDRQGEHDAAEDVIAVRRGLAELSARDRAVLILVDVEGLSMAEAAQALGSTTVAVKWRAVRARRRLRAEIEGKRRR